MPPMNDDDAAADVIDLQKTETEDKGDATPPDRGDQVTPAAAEPSIEALKAVANAKVAEPSAEEAAAAEASGGIPKSRFNEVNDRMKKAEAERAELQAKLDAALKEKPAAEAPKKEEPFDIDVQEQKYLEAIMEGNTAAAVAIRKAINGELTRQSKAEVTRELTQEREAVSLQTAAVEAIGKYPFLDSGAETANQQAIAEVVEWREFYRSKGQSAAEALRNAVAKVAPLYVDKKTPEIEPKADAKPDPRTLEAIAKGIKADAAQPKPLAGTGERASRAARDDVENMSDEEFEKLSAADKKRLRGDA